MVKLNTDFLVIAITRPDFHSGEADKINEILSDNLAHFVHIRKPYSKIQEVENLLDNISNDFYNRLKLHEHFELVNKYNLCGIHLNSRNIDAVAGVNNISKSIHSIAELDKMDNFDYFFISPVFNSISKKDYNATFELDDLASKIRGKRAIALGGVTPDKFSLLKSLGFTGAAMLGYFFPE